MIRNLLILLASALTTTFAAADIRVTSQPPPEVERGKVPVYEWTVDWALRDDDKPTEGNQKVYKTFAEARVAAEAMDASNRLVHGDGQDPKGKDRTWIKFIQITGKATLVPVGAAPLARRSWMPIFAGVLRGPTSPTQMVRDIGAAAKAPGLGGKEADELWVYFKTAADTDNWVRVEAQTGDKDKPTLSLMERANQFASDGYLVIGIASSAGLNKALKAAKDANPTDQKLREQAEFGKGHIFVVTPSGGGDWSSTVIANAAGTKAALVAADTKGIPVWQQPAYQFFAFKLAEK